MQQWLGTYRREAPVTSAIIAACLVVYAITAITSMSLYNVQASPLGQEMILWGPYHEPWRVLTSGFLHLDAGHVAVNMILLLLIGREIEKHVGHAAYAGVYLAGLLGSAAAVLWQNFDTPTAGASGAVYALMAVLVAVTARRGGDLRAPIVFVVANVAYSLLTPGISLWGHLGGLVVGALVAWPVTSPNPRTRWIAVAVAVIASALLCLVLL